MFPISRHLTKYAKRNSFSKQQLVQSLPKFGWYRDLYIFTGLVATACRYQGHLPQPINKHWLITMPNEILNQQEKLLWSLFPDSHTHKIVETSRKRNTANIKAGVSINSLQGKITPHLTRPSVSNEKVRLWVQKPVGDTAAKGNWVGQQAQMDKEGS